MKLHNETLTVEVSPLGAELTSIRKGQVEYLWQADPSIWGRHAPILFPIVGKVFGGQYRVGNETYSLSQHGFARDRQWTLLESSSTSLHLCLKSDPDTLKVYPYHFALHTEFILQHNTLIKRDTVSNLGSEPMFYQLGNHPGFLYRQFSPSDQYHGYLALFCNQQQLTDLELSQLTPDGYVVPDGQHLQLPQGILPLSDFIFQNDALVLEDSQVQQCVLLDKDFHPYLSVIFPDAEVLGIWSPKGKSAPFVCIEPWNGRADRDQYQGDITHRDWIQQLAPSASRTTEMRIVIK